MFTSSIGYINTYTSFPAIGFSLSGAYTVYRDMQGPWAKPERTALLAVFFIFSIALFPLVRKRIGSGPETFGIIMKQEHYQEMIQGCGQVFDSPHNEFIQYLFCTGILGAACYYAFLASCFFKGMQQHPMRKTSWIHAKTAGIRHTSSDSYLQPFHGVNAFISRKRGLLWLKQTASG